MRLVLWHSPIYVQCTGPLRSIAVQDEHPFFHSFCALGKANLAKIMFVAARPKLPRSMREKGPPYRGEPKSLQRTKELAVFSCRIASLFLLLFRFFIFIFYFLFL